MNTAIRLATIDDVRTVETIIADAYTHYIARIGRKPGPMLDDYDAQIRQQRVYVMDFDGVAKGVLVLIPETDVILLDNIAVLPSEQGKGIGRSLMQFAEEQARKAGYKKIRLYTHEKMAENIALYTRVGYIETHRAFENGLHRVFMTKLL